MMAPMLTLVLLFAACDGDSIDHDGDCEPIVATVSPGDTSAGFTPVAAVNLLDNHLPTEVSWDEVTLGDTSTDLSLTVEMDGDPELAQLADDATDCSGPDLWLNVPVAMAFRLAGGDVVAEGTTHVTVSELDLTHTLLDSGLDLPATLSGDYADQFDAWFEEEYGARGYELDGTWVVFGGTWQAPVFDIEFQATRETVQTSGVAWRGSWTIP